MSDFSHAYYVPVYRSGPTLFFKDDMHQWHIINTGTYSTSVVRPSRSARKSEWVWIRQLPPEFRGEQRVYQGCKILVNFHLRLDDESGRTAYPMMYIIGGKLRFGLWLILDEKSEPRLVVIE